MKKLVASVGVFALALSLAFAKDINWKADDGGMDGSFDDLNHWTGGVLPGLNDTAYLYFNSTTLPAQPFTVTMPRGVYTNYVALAAGPRIGAPVTVDGLDSMFVHPALESGSYPSTMFRIANKNDSAYFMHLSIAASAPNTSGPNLVLSNYLFTVSSDRDKQAKVEFQSGLYNFLDPLGQVWTSLPSRPILYLFANGYDYSMPMDETEIVFDAGTSLRAPMLGVTGNSSSNIVRFAGGTHVARALAAPCISDGQKWNKERTVTDIIVENDATFEVLGAYSPNNNANASNRLTRVFARNGGTVNFNTVNPGSGEIDFAAEGGTLNFRGDMDINSDSYTKFRRMSISATDGGQLSFGGTVNFGRVPRTDGLGDLSFGLDAATMTLTDTANFNVYGHEISATDGSVIENGGSFKVARGMVSLADSQFDNQATVNLTGGTLSLAGSQFENQGVVKQTAGTLSLAGSQLLNNAYMQLTGGTVEFTSGSCFENRVSLTNEAATLSFADSRIENYGIFCQAGGTLSGATITNNVGADMTIAKSVVSNATIATAASLKVTVGTSDFYDTEVDLVTIGGAGGGKFHVGNSHDTMTTLNFHSGLISNTYSKTAYDMYIGQQSRGTLNVYGGKVVTGQMFLGGGYSPNTVESVLRIEGGEVEVLCKGNGRGVGFQIAENASRHARLILNGGRFKSYTNGPGSYSDPAEWAKRHAYFEADGGTLTTPDGTSYLLYGFQEAKVGPKGLTIDNVRFNVTLEQVTFADKDDAIGEGRIILKGTGMTTFKGELSGVSYLVADEGTLDLTQLAVNAETGLSLGSLVSTNGATLKMDPEKTVACAGTLIFDNLKLTFSSALAADTAYDLFSYKTPLSEATLKALQRPTVAGVPAGYAAVLTQEEDGEGGYLLTMTIRQGQTAEITVPDDQTMTDSDNHYFPSCDTLAANVGAGGTLTLSGTLAFGTLEKDGAGILNLTGVGSQLLGGFVLKAGTLVLADTASLGLTSSGQTSSFRDGVVRISGPAEGAAILGPVSVDPTNANNVVVFDNAVDVMMQAPSSTTKQGSIVKRGAGEMTWEVEGTREMTGGTGNCALSGMYWASVAWTIVPFEFDETTGALTAGSHPALTVFEGALKVVGKGANAQLKTSGAISVGMRGAQGTVQPSLTLDNVYLNGTEWSNRFMVAPGMGLDDPKSCDDFVNTATVTLTNAASLYVYSMYVNRLNQNPNQRTVFDLSGNSWMNFTMLSPNRAGVAGTEAVYNFRDSNLYVGHGTSATSGGLELAWPFEMTFDHGVLRGSKSVTSGACAFARLYPEPNGSDVYYPKASYATFTFKNDSECRVRSVAYSDKAAQPIAFNFDGSAWIPGEGDYTFAWDDPTKIAITAMGAGLKLPVPAEKTWTLAQPILGRGPVVNDGAGTLKLAAGFDRTSGAVRAEEGATVDLDGAVHKIFIAGPGTFANGSIAAGGGLYLPVDDAFNVGPMPVLSNVTLPAATRVNIARDENPLVAPYQPIALFTYEGAAPDVSKWRLVGTGVQGLGGVFEAKDGVVTVTPVSKGLSYILR